MSELEEILKNESPDEIDIGHFRVQLKDNKGRYLYPNILPDRDVLRRLKELEDKVLILEGRLDGSNSIFRMG